MRVPDSSKPGLLSVDRRRPRDCNGRSAAEARQYNRRKMTGQIMAAQGTNISTNTWHFIPARKDKTGQRQHRNKRG